MTDQELHRWRRCNVCNSRGLTFEDHQSGHKLNSDAGATDTKSILQIKNDRIAHLEARIEKLKAALIFYGREESILSGSDYAAACTSSYRYSTDDGGLRARAAIADDDAGGGA